MTELTRTAELTKRDMHDALPRYYDDSPEVDAIMTAEAVQIDRTRHRARELTDQFYVRSATHGLNDWERVLGLSPRPNSSLTFRRNRILARLNGTAPATVRYLTDVVNAHVADKSARIIEVNGEYRFLVEVDATSPLDTIAIAADLDEMKPAHLDYAYRQVVRSTVYYASALSAGEEVTVYPWSPTSIELHGQVSLGSYLYDYETTSIYPKEGD